MCLMHMEMTTANLTRPILSIRSLFCGGSLKGSAGVSAEIPIEEYVIALGRHFKGDWGDVDEFDWEVNNHAVNHGGSLLSAYRSSKDVRFFVMTEANREVTTVFLASDL